MKNLLYKEFCLTASPLSYIFLAFTLMTFLPGYPILCGAFFVSFGIFHSYQSAREDNDILFSVLLPVKKTDVVRAKYISAVILQLTAFFLCAVFTLIRMGLMSDAEVYRTNVLMNANLVFLAFVLLIFALFNLLFLGGFFKTAYRFGKPFVIFIIVNFLVVGIAETLHHLPGLGWLNSGDLSVLPRQALILLCALIAYAAMTAASCIVSQKRFEKLDL